MAKDPAFLFYSKDFYEGTRTMLPKERACYVDLMIYQHQHGAIPNDIERISMYCNGIDEATLKSTLDAKFKLTDNGWINNRLQIVIDERREFSSKQSANGLVGQFFKKAKSSLSTKDYRDLKHYVYNVYTKEALIQSLQKEEATHEGLLKALLKHLVIVDEDVNEDVNNKGIEDEEIDLSKPTEFEEFWTLYGKKEGRFSCEQLWRKLEPKDYPKILEHVPKFVKASGEFLINPEKYLEKRRWLDEHLPNYTTKEETKKPIETYVPNLIFKNEH